MWPNIYVVENKCFYSCCNWLTTSEGGLLFFLGAGNLSSASGRCYAGCATINIAHVPAFIRVTRLRPRTLIRFNL